MVYVVNSVLASGVDRILEEDFVFFCSSRDGNSSIDALNPNSFNDPPNVFTHPPQPQYESYSCELYGNDSHYGFDCPPRLPLVYEQEPCYNQNFGDNYYPQNLHAIKARFGKNESSKKMQKNLLKQQFETFTIGSREELDSAYERFHHKSKIWRKRSIKEGQYFETKFITQKPWWRTDNNEDIDLDQEFDAEHNKADDAPVSLALMATNSEVPYCSKCSKSYKKLLESYQQKEIYCQRARTEILGYQMSLESLEVMLKTHEKNEYAWGDKAKSYKAVPPPTGTIIPPRANVSFTGIDELAIRNKVVDQEKTKSSQSAIDRNKVIIEDWVDSDDEETDVSESQKETAFNSENSETSFENSQNSVGQESRTKGLGNKGGKLCFGNPEEDLKDYAIIDSGCSGSGRISGKGTIKTSCLDFEKVSYVEELKFNLLSVSQICDKKHNNDVYSLDLKNIIPSGGITCLVAKATEDEAVLWHRRLGHVNFKNINKLVKGNLERKLSDSNEQGISVIEDEDLDDNQFIVHTASAYASGRERTAAKEVSLSTEEQALHDELVSLMHQESLAKAHNDDQRIAFEEEKRRISIAKGKEHVDSTFTLSTANTPPQSTGNTPTDSDDDTPKDGIFSTNSFDAEEGGVADYNNMDPTIDVPSTPTLRIHKIHPQSQIIGKSTAGVQTRRKLQDSTSNQHQALLSFIYKQNRTNHKDQQTCLFACFLSQEEPKKVSQVLANESWLKRCKKNCYNSSYKMQGCYVTYQKARG
ncbi:ribonuclease H-like domain-containing protein [Tanacetum coccineum]